MVIERVRFDIGVWLPNGLMPRQLEVGTNGVTKLEAAADRIRVTVGTRVVDVPFSRALEVLYREGGK